MSSKTLQPVRRRQVFYLPGYDPFPPRRYRELYRREAAAQARITSDRFEIVAAPGGAGYGWRVEAVVDQQQTITDFEVLTWSDIVHRSFDAPVMRTYYRLCRTAAVYIGTGALWRLLRLRKGPVLAALYPVAMLSGQFALAVVAGFVAAEAVLALGEGVISNAFITLALAAAVALGVAGFVLRAFRAIDNRFFAYYLMNDFAYAASHKGAYPPELEARLERFSARIAAALQSEVDEVLIVGHSSGAHLAISAVSDVLRSKAAAQSGGAQEKQTGQARPALALLTLGHVVPMMTFLPRAQRLRRDLRVVAQAPGLFWADVSAPGDGCCFALCDPVAVSGQGRAGGRPVIFSAAFTKSLSPARWRALRWRFFRLHFQYLCAFDRPRDYDYFRITAGPLGLRARYGARKSSPGVIASPVTAYADVSSADGAP